MTRTRGGVVRKFTWTCGGNRRETWGYSVNVNGRKIRKQGFLSKGEALDALEAFKNPTPAPATPVATMTLAEAFERYFQAKARKRSLYEDRRTAKCLVAEFGAETPLTEITASRISAWKAQRLATTSWTRPGELLSPAAVNRPLALFRHLLRLAHEELEVLPVVPRVRLEKENQGRLRWLTPEEATRLLDSCRASRNRDLADFVELALYTRMRRGELLGLQWADVDRSRGVVLLEVTKSGKRREVPLNGPADAVLARRGGSEGMVFGSRTFFALRKAWGVAVRRAKLIDVHFHDLRHTFASWAIQRGATLPELKDLLGHSTLAMVMRYAHLAPEHLRSAVARLDDVLQGGGRAEEVCRDVELLQK